MGALQPVVGSAIVALVALLASAAPVGDSRTAACQDPTVGTSPASHAGRTNVGERDSPRTPGERHDQPGPTVLLPGKRPLRRLGLSTWYAGRAGEAAAGPALRDALGPGWRGRRVRVEAGGRAVVVRLSDWCACGDRAGQPTLIDLSAADFRRLSPLRRGIISVAIEAAP
jgi:hypothetical protein